MSDSGTQQQEGVDKVCTCKGDRGWFIVSQTMVCNWCKMKIVEDDEELT